MLPFAVAPCSRPDRLTDIKDEKYHLSWARYTAIGINNPTAIAFYLKCYRNRYNHKIDNHF